MVLEYLGRRRLDRHLCLGIYLALEPSLPTDVERACLVAAETVVDIAAGTVAGIRGAGDARTPGNSDVCSAAGAL